MKTETKKCQGTEEHDLTSVGTGKADAQEFWWQPKHVCELHYLIQNILISL